jgi:MYXO-CTERM domain-containing protein
MIASAATITGFNSSLFTLNNSLFVGATGTFAIEQRSIDGGQGLFVTYSGGGSEPIPEPGTWAAAALLALAAGYVRRRRNRASGATKC